MTDDYYLIHGQMLDSEHESFDDATERANQLMSNHGINHSMIKIGCRDKSQINDILVIYCKLAKYPREDTIS